jgi:hypothetical protein
MAKYGESPEVREKFEQTMQTRFQNSQDYISYGKAGGGKPLLLYANRRIPARLITEDHASLGSLDFPTFSI